MNHRSKLTIARPADSEGICPAASETDQRSAARAGFNFLSLNSDIRVGGRNAEGNSIYLEANIAKAAPAKQRTRARLRTARRRRQVEIKFLAIS